MIGRVSRRCRECWSGGGLETSLRGDALKRWLVSSVLGSGMEPLSQLGFSSFTMRGSLACSLFCFFLNLFFVLTHQPRLVDKKTLNLSFSLTISTATSF